MGTYSNHRIKEIIDEYIHSPRDRTILLESLANRTKYETIAEMTGISRTTVARTVKRERPLILQIYRQREAAQNDT